MSARAILKQILPPVVIQFFRTARARITTGDRLAEWEYVPEGWDHAHADPRIKGWNVQTVLETCRKKWPRFQSLVSGSGPLGVSHESALTTNTDLSSHNTVMIFGYVLALAGQRRDRISLLDWGGGIGHYYLLAKALLPQVTIEYHCKDFPLLAQYGARLFPEQHFHSDRGCLNRMYDLILASSSLHYSEEWEGLLADLARAASEYLLVTRLPVVFEAPSYVYVQRAYDYGYRTEYLGWCLNRDQFLAKAVRSGLHLMREFVIGENPRIVNAPEACHYRGFLFRSSTST